MQHAITLNPSIAKLTTAHDRLRLQRGAEHLHRLGARGVHEFLTELGEATATAPVILGKLEAWSALEPAMVRAVLEHYGTGHDFPPHLAAVPA